MKIANASLEMASSHVLKQSSSVRESLRMWVGSQRPDFEGRNRPAAHEPVQISDAGKNAQQSDSIDNKKDASNGDPRIQMLISLIEALTGRKVTIFDASQLQTAQAQNTGDLPQATQQSSQQTSQQPAGYGVEYDYRASYSESEQTSFAASGTVQTADGKRIDFQVRLAMQRSYSEETSVSLRLGDATRKTDPLVINFAGTAAQLTNTRFQFDLNSDGTTENINFVGQGSGFLIFDRNHDGKANNGSELFGPASGNGFQELAALDSDANGWIDENDAAYQDLRVWSKDTAGRDQLRTLKEANVGAIALSNVGTPFDLKNAANETLGQIKSSSIFLGDDGKAGTVQQIDLTV